MTRNSSLVILAVGLSLAAVSVSAQPGRQPEPAGPFTVGGTARTAVLVDTLTGRTWRLVGEGGSDEPVWLPIRRIDQQDEAERWKAEDAVRRQQYREQQAADYRERMLEEERDRLRGLRKRLGPNHPHVQRLEQELQIEPSNDDGRGEDEP